MRVSRVFQDRDEESQNLVGVIRLDTLDEQVD